MNIKIHNVINDISGASGIKIIKAIIKGERDANELVSLCNQQILNKKKEQLIAALEGNYEEEYVFMLKQSLSCLDFYLLKINECDKEIEFLLKEMTKQKELPQEVKPAKSIKNHKPNIKDLHMLLMKITMVKMLHKSRV